jgi:hypothetical protein
MMKIYFVLDTITSSFIGFQNFDFSSKYFCYDLSNLRPCRSRSNSLPVLCVWEIVCGSVFESVFEYVRSEKKKKKRLRLVIID